MSLYRATNKLISRLMSARIPARAIAVNQPSDMHTDGGIGGRQFAELIDPMTRSFSMPPQFLGPNTQQLCVLMAHQVSDTGEGPASGKFYLNKNFEGEFAGIPWINHMTTNGWLTAVGAVTDANIQAPQKT